MVNKSVLLVFRNPALGGKSVEEIFQGLLKFWNKNQNIHAYVFSPKKSFLKNALDLRKYKAEVFHFTGGGHFLMYFLFGRKIILTIHDIGRLKELKGIRKLAYQILLLKLPMRLAHTLTTVSQFTKDEIIQHFGKKWEKRIQVIPNPLPENFVPQVKKFDTTLPRILQVGTQPHKNLETVIQALRTIPCVLVIIGPLHDQQLALLQQNNIQFQQYTNLSYEGVYDQYCRADIVIFMSLYEGFGMPILEANAIGRPVIASRLQAHEEVGLNAIHYIESPMDAVEIKEGVARVIASEAYRNTLIEKGFQNAKRFQMSIIAEKYEQLYKQVGEEF